MDERTLIERALGSAAHRVRAPSTRRCLPVALLLASVAMPMTGATEEQSCAPGARSELTGNELRVCFENPNDYAVALSSVTIEWPAHAGPLLTTRMGTVLTDGPIAPPKASLDYFGRKHSAPDRTLAPGETKVLVFVFENLVESLPTERFIVSMRFVGVLPGQ